MGQQSTQKPLPRLTLWLDCSDGLTAKATGVSHEWPCGFAGYCLPKEQQRLWDERRGVAKQPEEVEDSEGSVEEVEEVLPDASAQR